MELETAISTIENQMASLAQAGDFSEVKKLESELTKQKTTLALVTSEWESLIA
jgi:hypothetical protein